MGTQQTKVTVQSDPQWAGFLADKLAHHTENDPRWATLGERLLAIGGGGVAACIEEDMDDLIGPSARQWSPEHCEMVGGLPSQCHSNSVALQGMNPDLSIVTGWALSDDGCWRQHTWCIDEQDFVYETTEPRTAYYGFVLQGDKLDDFIFMNW